MKAPEHIKIARKEGAKAGLEHLHAYLARNTNEGTNGLETNRVMLDEIRSAGGFRKRGRNAGTFKNEDKAVAWYCNHFAKKFGTDKLPPVKATRRVNRTSSQAEQVTPNESTPEVDPTDVASVVAAAVAAAMGALANGDTDDEDEDDDSEIEAEATPARRVQRQAAAPTTEYPGPRDPDADATNGKLWTLNTEGPEFGYFLVVIDEDGNLVAGGEGPLRNGECHELIAEIRADS